MATIRDYGVTVTNITAYVTVNDRSKTSYAALPTLAEIFSVTGEPVEVISLEYCFVGCESLITAPAIPNGVTNMEGCFFDCYSLTTAPTIPSSVTNMEACFLDCGSLTTAPAIPNGVTNMQACFNGCTALTTAPTIPNSVVNMGTCFLDCRSLTTAPTIPNSVINMSSCFDGCRSLTTAPTIPNSVINMSSCFYSCTALTTAPTIPSSVTNLNDCFSSCTALTGKITINANPSSYMDCMWETQRDIVLVGSSALLQNIADTASNGNVYVWSLSINLSAERQENDFSKADVSVIINRFRNNNESVSLTFTIDSVESAPVQVTMDTATKTYTGVLSITPSSIVELSVIAEDSYGKSAPKSITIPIPFYTIDFQAGGKEVAVGAPANDDTSNRPYGLFKCGMDLVVTRLVGEIKMWAGDAIPYGWLLCDGSEVSKTEYPYLYASIGDLWGTPNSSSNFKLPNLAGNVPVGYNSADADFNTVGKTGGKKTHKLTPTEMPSHGHSGKGWTFSVYKGTRSSESVGAISGSGFLMTQVKEGGSWGGYSATPDAGGNGAHNNLQPYAVVKYIICAF